MESGWGGTPVAPMARASNSDFLYSRLGFRCTPDPDSASLPPGYVCARSPYVAQRNTGMERSGIRAGSAEEHRLNATQQHGGRVQNNTGAHHSGTRRGAKGNAALTKGQFGNERPRRLWELLRRQVDLDMEGGANIDVGGHRHLTLVVLGDDEVREGQALAGVIIVVR